MNRWVELVAAVSVVGGVVGLVSLAGREVKQEQGQAVPDPYRHDIKIVSAEATGAGCIGLCPPYAHTPASVDWEVESNLTNIIYSNDQNPALQGIVCVAGTWGNPGNLLDPSKKENCSTPFSIKLGEIGVAKGKLTEVYPEPLPTKQGGRIALELRVGKLSPLKPAMDIVAETVAASPTW